jgi:hypothetical protein
MYLDEGLMPGIGYPTFHLCEAHFQWFYAAVSKSWTYIKKM